MVLYLAHKYILISVRIPSEKIMTIDINWSVAKCSCPSWSAITDESALKSALATLDSSSSSLYWWLGFWTTLVAVGVVLEVVFVVWEYLEELHDFRRGFIHAPEKPLTALFVMGLLGAGLVAAGVSGELWEESRIGAIETCIRRGNDALSSLLSKEATTAQEAARLAKLEADGAKASAKEAEETGEVAQEKTGQVDKKANALNSDLVSAKSKLDAVEAKRAELEKSLVNMAGCNAPRVLPFWRFQTRGGPEKTMVDALTPFAGEDVVIQIEPNDAEVRRAARDLIKVLHIAGWSVKDDPVPMEGIEDGVNVAPFEADGPDQVGFQFRAADAAKALIDFLQSYNWEARQGWLTDPNGALVHGTAIVPLGGLRVQIGLYPAVTFVAPPGAKEVIANREEYEKQLDEKSRNGERNLRSWIDQASGNPCRPLSTVWPNR